MSALVGSGKAPKMMGCTWTFSTVRAGKGAGGASSVGAVAPAGVCANGPWLTAVAVSCPVVLRLSQKAAAMATINIATISTPMMPIHGRNVGVVRAGAGEGAGAGATGGGAETGAMRVVAAEAMPG